MPLATYTHPVQCTERPPHPTPTQPPPTPSHPHPMPYAHAALSGDAVCASECARLAWVDRQPLALERVGEEVGRAKGLVQRRHGERVRPAEACTRSGRGCEWVRPEPPSHLQPYRRAGAATLQPHHSRLQPCSPRPCPSAPCPPLGRHYSRVVPHSTTLVRGYGYLGRCDCRSSGRRRAGSSPACRPWCSAPSG